MPRSGYLLIIAIIVTAKEIVRTSAILFYVLQKKATVTEVAYFSNIYGIIIKHFIVLSSHVALVSVAPHK